MIRAPDHQEASTLTNLAMESKAHWGYSPAFMNACKTELTVSVEKLENINFFYRVMEIDNEITGFYSLEKLDDGHFELEALFVDPIHMGKGFGKTLFLHAKSLAHAQGGSIMHIQADPNAKAFYTGLGCVFIKETESLSIPGRLLPKFSLLLEENRR